MHQLISRFTLCSLFLLSLLSPLSQANPMLALQSGDGTETEQSQTEDKPDSPELNLVGALGIDELGTNIEQRFNGLLEKYGLNSSLAGKLLSTLGIIIIGIILYTLLRRILASIFQRLHNHSDRIFLDRGRLRLYEKITAWFIALLVIGVGLITLASIWSSAGENPFHIDRLAEIFLPLFNFLLVVIFCIIFFEAISSLVESYLKKISRNGSPRIHTLLPIVRNLLYGTLLAMLGLTILSQLGIDIVPLMAGAGVVGFAVAFGAQTLIKDVITGFIIILEDLIQVGDVVTLAGKTGLIEKITIRKVQLRDLSGIVYTVPFSEIGVVENLTKEFSYYLMDVGIAYRENPDEVVELLRGICEEMRQEEPYKTDILGPIEIFGVDQFADSAIVIKARIKTRPIRQWDTGREFNRRMKHVFDAHNIEIPFPHQTIYFGEDKEGSAPAARILMERKKAQKKVTNEQQQAGKQPTSDTADSNLPGG